MSTYNQYLKSWISVTAGAIIKDTGFVCYLAMLKLTIFFIRPSTYIDHDRSKFFKFAGFQLPAMWDNLILIMVICVLSVIAVGHQILIFHFRFKYVIP